MTDWNAVVCWTAAAVTVHCALGLLVLGGLRRRWGTVGTMPTTGLLVGALLLTLAPVFPRWSIQIASSRAEVGHADQPLDSATAATNGSPWLLPMEQVARWMPGGSILSERSGDTSLSWTSPALWWLVSVTVGATRLAFALVGIFRIRQLPLVTDWAVQKEVAQLAQQIGMTSAISVRIDPSLGTAAAIGLGGRTILLAPNWTDWTASQRQTVLRHELFHLAAKHSVVWLLAQCVLALHFYHPLVHWLVRWLHAEQEHAADCHVAGSMGIRPYVTTLSQLALQRSPGGIWVSARHTFGTPGALIWRIRMLEHNRGLLLPKRTWLAGLFVGVTVLSVLSPRIDSVRAQLPEAVELDHEPQTPSAVVNARKDIVGYGVIRPAALAKLMGSSRESFDQFVLPVVSQLTDISIEDVEELRGAIHATPKTADKLGTVMLSTYSVRLVAGKSWKTALAKFQPVYATGPNGWESCTISSDHAPPVFHALANLKEYVLHLPDERTLVFSAAAPDQKAEWEIDPQIWPAWDKAAVGLWIDSGRVREVAANSIVPAEEEQISRHAMEVLGESDVIGMVLEPHEGCGLELILRGKPNSMPGLLGKVNALRSLIDRQATAKSAAPLPYRCEVVRHNDDIQVKIEVDRSVGELFEPLAEGDGL